MNFGILPINKINFYLAKVNNLKTNRNNIS